VELFVGATAGPARANTMLFKPTGFANPLACITVLGLAPPGSCFVIVISSGTTNMKYCLQQQGRGLEQSHSKAASSYQPSFEE
jgi:hypothetical protein